MPIYDEYCRKRTDSSLRNSPMIVVHCAQVYSEINNIDKRLRAYRLSYWAFELPKESLGRLVAGGAEENVSVEV